MGLILSGAVRESFLANFLSFNALFGKPVFQHTSSPVSPVDVHFPFRHGCQQDQVPLVSPLGDFPFSGFGLAKSHCTVPRRDGSKTALSRHVRERSKKSSERAKRAVREQERAEREQEKAVRKHKREHREPVLAFALKRSGD